MRPLRTRLTARRCFPSAATIQFLSLGPSTGRSSVHRGATARTGSSGGSGPDGRVFGEDQLRVAKLADVEEAKAGARAAEDRHAVAEER